MTGTTPECVTWYEQTSHGPGFRNAKDYGAKGDGIADDSDAIIEALTSGRSAKPFTTLHPTLVYLPPGRYLVSKTLPLYFYTHIVGNFRCLPTIVAKEGSFTNRGECIACGRHLMVDRECDIRVRWSDRPRGLFASHTISVAR